jgi:hypothetical protein
MREDSTWTDRSTDCMHMCVRPCDGATNWHTYQPQLFANSRCHYHPTRVLLVVQDGLMRILNSLYRHEQIQANMGKLAMLSESPC